VTTLATGVASTKVNVTNIVENAPVPVRASLIYSIHIASNQEHTILCFSVQGVFANLLIARSIDLVASNDEKIPTWLMNHLIHKLPEIFHKLSRNFKKSCSKFAHKNKQKLLFVTKGAQKLLENTKTFFGLMLKSWGGGGGDGSSP